MYYLVILAIAAGLGLIPANIAKTKGHSFSLWWFYGWMLFIVAIIHVNFIEDLSSPKVAKQATDVYAISIPDEIKKYKRLLDEGVIIEEEFRLKKQLLGLRYMT